MSEWLVVLITTNNGQRIAVSQEADGPVLGEAASQEEALQYASEISDLTGVPLFSLDDEW